MSMASTFRFENHAKENQDVFATRKAGLNSARKPLTDKSVNKNINNTNVARSVKKKNFTEVKPKVQDYPKWLFDGCSYNLEPTEETYNDIWPQPPRFDRDSIMRIVCPPTPPPCKEIEIEPEIYELPLESKSFFDNCILQEKVIEDFDFPPPTFLF